jgi:hypothetical protein
MFHVDPSFETDQAPTTPDGFALGYVMGLIVGEGSFTGDRLSPLLSVKLHQRDPEPLRFLMKTLGGKIYGPYQHDGRHFNQYYLRGPALRQALPLFLSHLPPSWKRAQFLAWAVRYRLLGDASDASG